MSSIAKPKDSAQIKKAQEQIRVDMLNLATAIEAYYVDHNEYPAMTDVAGESPNRGRNGALPAWTFLTKGAGGQLSTITTPIGYLYAYPKDPYAFTDGDTFYYYSWSSQKTDHDFWVLLSPGPDGDIDFNPDSLQIKENMSASDWEAIRKQVLKGVVTGSDYDGDFIRTHMP